MSSLTGVKCTNSDLILDAFDQLLQHAVQLLCEHINKACPDKDHKIECGTLRRNLVASMLNKCPVTCQRLRSTARDDTRYTAIMFYERTRLGAARSGHFLESLAPGLPLFSGHTNVMLKDDDLRKLKLRDVVADRIRTVSNLELMEDGTERLEKLISDYRLTDAADGMPGRVHIFVARMRAICQGLQRVKPATHFKQCKNCECCRVFYCGAPNEVSGPAASSTSPTSPTSDSQGGTYWDLAAGSPEIADEQGAFCTFSCCMQWRWQLRNALPDSSDDAMVADNQCRKEGRSRVPEAMRALVKRNERAGRHLRSIEKKHMVFTALSKSELKKQRERRVRQLNVDLGMLFLANILAESRTLCTNKVLAGAAEGWRSRPLFYAKVLKEVGKLYDKHHVGNNVISNMHVGEPFLAKLKEKAANLF